MDWSLRSPKSLAKQQLHLRRLNTNKTQILHHIRLKKFVPNTPLEDKYKEEKLQPDEELIIPQDDLYTISWEADFEYNLFQPRKDNWPDADTRLPNDVARGGVDYYVTEDECSRENESDVIEKKVRAQPILAKRHPRRTNRLTSRRMKMTSLKINQGRDRPIVETRRPHQIHRLMGRKVKMTSLMT